jgi:hypothetical protein
VAQTGEQRFSRFSFRCEKRLRHQSETRSENRLLRFSVKNGGARDGILVPNAAVRKCPMCSHSFSSFTWMKLFGQHY